MPTLKEIKTRIASVRSTLKITSAMKLVASAKLRRAQQATEGLRPYEAELHAAFSTLLRSGGFPTGRWTEQRTPRSVALVAFASNASLCGAFNANAVRAVLNALKEYEDADVALYAVGRKMAEAMRKAGFPSCEELNHLADKPGYAGAAEFADRLSEGFLQGKYDRVDLVYTHFVSAARQVPVRETLLPFKPALSGLPEGAATEEKYIFEPPAPELFEALLPRVLKLSLYSALLDSQASEHAARTVAMQAATDNGEDLLQELTLQYNKSRQQKITAEILDLAGGIQE